MTDIERLKNGYNGKLYEATGGFSFDPKTDVVEKLLEQAVEEAYRLGQAKLNIFTFWAHIMLWADYVNGNTVKISFNDFEQMVNKNYSNIFAIPTPPQEKE